MEQTPRMADHALLCRAAAAGSMVLLKNVNNALPLLAEGGQSLPVAVFGSGQVHTACCTAGMQPWRTISILDGLRGCEAVKPDGLLMHKYTAWCLEHPLGDEMPLGNLSMEEFTQENRAAIAVITRKADDKNLTLTAAEEDLLRRVRGAFDRMVLVLNTPGYVQLSDTARRADAIVFMGLAGQEGGHALADLLCGKVVPSGKLAAAWPLSPAAFDRANERLDRFCGYRYFDSFDEDLLYGFGHGLGYGASALSAVSVGLEGCELVISAQVENTGGTWPLRETVQVYASTPNENDPVWQLAAYAKTRLLEPGESQDLTLRFPITQLASFREDSCAYVLDAGYYDIRVGTESRSTYIAGSLRLTRSALVKAAGRLPFAPAKDRTRGQAFTYPGEAAELSAARKRAIRFSDRDLPRQSRKKGREFTGCLGDDQVHTLSQLQKGWCSPFQLIASMSDEALRAFVCDFGFCPTQVPGALGASRAIERHELPALTVAAGGEGLHLQKELRDEEDKVLKRQNCTAFPAASLLACSFDPELIRAVGAGIGREAREYGVKLWLAPGANLQTRPDREGLSNTWSEDPLVCGSCAAALATGLGKQAAPVLCSEATRSGSISQDAFHNLYAKGFALACRAYPAALLPDVQLCGQFCGEDSDPVRALLVDFRFTGMFLSDRERYNAAPSRVALEKSALRMLKALF